MKNIQLLAPAKINLFLQICGKRPDGYHNINTVFSKVELFDKITLTPLKSTKKIDLRVINNCRCKLPPAKDNIIIKAIEKFRIWFRYGTKNNTGKKYSHRSRIRWWLFGCGIDFKGFM
jgi:4-diphosphocytidyl-2-C-methyl-D-erythritol kinase